MDLLGIVIISATAVSIAGVIAMGVTMICNDAPFFTTSREEVNLK